MYSLLNKLIHYIHFVVSSLGSGFSGGIYCFFTLQHQQILWYYWKIVMLQDGPLVQQEKERGRQLHLAHLCPSGLIEHQQRKVPTSRQAQLQF